MPSLCCSLALLISRSSSLTRRTGRRVVHRRAGTAGALAAGFGALDAGADPLPESCRP